MANIEITDEQAEVLASILECVNKKDPGLLKVLLQRYFGWWNNEEPSMAGLLKYAEHYIRTQHGLYVGSWSGESGPYEITISFKVKQDKTTT